MYVTLKSSVKVFDKAVEKAVRDALQAAVTKAIDGGKNMSTTKKEALTLVLTASASVEADDKSSPKLLKGTVSIDGLLTGAGAQSFKASGKGQMDGLNAKKLDKDAADLVDSIAADLMKSRVVPAAQKMAAG